MSRVDGIKTKKSHASKQKMPVYGVAKWSTYLVLVLLVIVAVVGVYNTTATYSAYHNAFLHPGFLHTIDNNQYAHLARALSEGHLYLDLPVDAGLAQLDNPYDFNARYELICETGATIYWDYAFYEGHYYTYFGVLPAVFVYLPYLLATGTDLSTPDATLFLCILAIIACAVFVYELASWFYKNKPPLFALVVGFLLMALSSNVFDIAFCKRFYYIPLAFSLVLTFAGLACWVHAKRKYASAYPSSANSKSSRKACAAASGTRAEFHGESHSRLHVKSRLRSCSNAKSHAKHVAIKQPTGWLVAGSALMVLNFGARPQFMLAALLAFPLFWREIFQDRVLFSKRSVGTSVGIVAAVIVCLAPLCLYNMARFGQPLNNGSFYNLTGFDMQNYVQRKRDTLQCLFYYLIQEPVFINEFPWITTTQFEFLDWVPQTPMHGGIIFLIPALLFVCASPFVKINKEIQGTKFLRISAFVMGCIILYIDAKLCGVYKRYFTDFVYLWGIVALLNIYKLTSSEGWSVFAHKTKRVRSASCVVMRVVVGIMMTYSVLMCALTTIEPTQWDSVLIANPELYNSISSLFS